MRVMERHKLYVSGTTAKACRKSPIGAGQADGFSSREQTAPDYWSRISQIFSRRDRPPYLASSTTRSGAPPPARG